MRDIKRIAKLLKRFRIAWEMQPDLRLSQIIQLLQYHYVNDLYYTEDEELITYIEDLLKSNRGNLV